MLLLHFEAISALLGGLALFHILSDLLGSAHLLST
jgi:hypothetical protein